MPDDTPDELDLVGGPDDAALMTELRVLARSVDPVPEGVLASARASFTWRTIDAELAEFAELGFDSAFEDKELAGARGDDGFRLLTFTAADLTIEAEVIGDGSQRRLVGQLVPPGPGMVEVRHAAGVALVEADELGRFTADDLAAGPVSLRCRFNETGRQVSTEWVAI